MKSVPSFTEAELSVVADILDRPISGTPDDEYIGSAEEEQDKLLAERMVTSNKNLHIFRESMSEPPSSGTTLKIGNDQIMSSKITFGTVSDPTSSNGSFTGISSGLRAAGSSPVITGFSTDNVIQINVNGSTVTIKEGTIIIDGVEIHLDSSTAQSVPLSTLIASPNKYAKNPDYDWQEDDEEDSSLF